MAAAVPTMGARLGAEALGTFWLVLGGCGTAVLAATFPDVGVGLLGVALAFGLTVLTMAYAVGHVSGGHFNPAVTVGLAVARRFSWRDVLPYVVTQVVAATLAGAVLLVVASGRDGFDRLGWFPNKEVLQTIALFAATVLAAGLSYRYLEQPFLRRKSRWTRVPSRPV